MLTSLVITKLDGLFECELVRIHLGIEAVVLFKYHR
jgi:hypothetical protein